MKKTSNLENYLFASLLLILLACNKEDSPEPPPTPPTNLASSITSSSQIDLSWTDNSENETGFTIERKLGSESYTVITTTEANKNSYSDNNLEEFTNYSYRIFAINAAHEIGEYSNEVTARTFGKAILETSEVSNITPFAAIVNSNISDEKGSSVTSRGVVWSTSTNPTIELETKTENGSGSGNFSSELSGLNWETEYYIRAYATNSAGTAYGTEITFNTEQISIITSPISNIDYHSATSGGMIDGEGGSSIVTRGLVWGTDPEATVNLSTKTEDSTGTGVFVSSIESLLPNTTYYARAYASNNETTSYGPQISFITDNEIKDIEGNTYSIVAIGSQIWMAENLRTMKYNDGTEIPEITDNTVWANLTTAGFSWYDNDEAQFKHPYGAMYNWYANDTGKLCPEGWHIPTVSEWDILINFLGGLTVAGGKIKDAGLDYWDDPNTGASNESGFTALGAGYRSSDGSFVLIRRETNIHVAAPSSTMLSVIGLTHQMENITFSTVPSKNSDISNTNPLENYGYVVRCISN
ncbi:MAG: fibronectin type III domain-containing protein [Cyclobacteriaceae bacterium]